MDDGRWLFFSGSVLLLLFAFYFSAAETALSSSSKIRIKAKADRGDRAGERAMYLLDNFDKTITTLLIGSNIVNLCLASIATVFAIRQWGVGAPVVAAATGVTTLVIFFLAEMLPKSIAKKYSERLTLSTSASLCFMVKILTPVSFFLTAAGTAFSRLTKGDPEVTVTEDELYDIIENMKDEGEIGAERGSLVHSALMFADVTVETILTARVDVVAIDIDDTRESILSQIKSQKHSRLPVYKGSVDSIIGVLQIRKFMKAYLKQGFDLDLISLLDEAYFAHQSTNIDELLTEMSAKKLNMAIVTDNYGGTLGIVTVEDILEELVGEIWDEDDDVVVTFSPLPDGRFEIDASLPVHEAFELMGYDDPMDTDFNHKLAGEWAYEQFDLIPSEGDSFTYNDLEVTVSRMTQHRIVKLTARKPPGPEKAGDEA